MVGSTRLRLRVEDLLFLFREQMVFVVYASHFFVVVFLLMDEKGVLVRVHLYQVRFRDLLVLTSDFVVFLRFFRRVSMVRVIRVEVVHLVAFVGRGIHHLRYFFGTFRIHVVVRHRAIRYHVAQILFRSRVDRFG